MEKFNEDTSQVVADVSVLLCLLHLATAQGKASLSHAIALLDQLSYDVVAQRRIHSQIHIVIFLLSDHDLLCLWGFPFKVLNYRMI
jgi:hypothetical protein